MSNVFMVNIRGLSYKVKVISEKSFDNLYGKDSLAVTLPEKSLMVFRPSSTDLGTIRHEVCHAFVAGSLLDTTESMSRYDIEENFCEIFSRFGTDMIKVSNEMYKKLKGSKTK